MALAMIEQSPPHIAIIDVNMPEMNGVELNRAIQERFPFIQTIMLSGYDDYDYVRECLKNGSIDYLLKHRLDGAALVALLNKAVLEIRQQDRLEERKTHEAVAERLNPALIRDYIVYLVSGRKDATTEVKAFSQKQPVHPRVKLCGDRRADCSVPAADGVIQRRANEPPGSAGGRYDAQSLGIFRSGRRLTWRMGGLLSCSRSRSGANMP